MLYHLIVYLMGLVSRCPAKYVREIVPVSCNINYDTNMGYHNSCKIRGKIAMKGPASLSYSVTP